MPTMKEFRVYSGIGKPAAIINKFRSKRGHVLEEMLALSNPTHHS